MVSAAWTAATARPRSQTPDMTLWYLHRWRAAQGSLGELPVGGIHLSHTVLPSSPMIAGQIYPLNVEAFIDYSDRYRMANVTARWTMLSKPRTPTPSHLCRWSSADLLARTCGTRVPGL